MNYIPKCLRGTPKAKTKPRRQAIKEAQVAAFNQAISIVLDKCRIEKSERMKANMYAAVSEIARLRDSVK